MQGIALIHVYLDGSVSLSHGGCEIGQGLNTKLLQVNTVVKFGLSFFSSSPDLKAQVSFFDHQSSVIRFTFSSFFFPRTSRPILIKTWHKAYLGEGDLSL